MYQAYYWRTREDGALLVIVFGLLGIVQTLLSYFMAMVYWIISPIVLTFVPLGIVLAQGAATAILGNLFAIRVFPLRERRGVPQPTPTRRYTRNFTILLLAMVIVLGIWGGVFAFIWFFSIWTQIAYLTGYIIGNTAGALTVLIIIGFIDWLFNR